MPLSDITVVINRHIDNPIYVYHKVRKGLMDAGHMGLAIDFMHACANNISSGADFINTVRKFVTVKCLVDEQQHKKPKLYDGDGRIIN